MLSISSFIIKATAVCNLNCSYCYMFNLKDRSYQGRPRTMPGEIVTAAARRITDYARKYELREVPIIIHGGEPLMAGKEWMRSTVKKFQDAAAGGVDYQFLLQTNGALLTPAWIELFRELEIKVSLSMDGPRHIHDRTRVNHAGRGSYDDVVRGLRLLLEAPDIFGGALCVIDPAEDGLEVYHHFRSLGVTRMDFLLPLEYNWDNPPPFYREDADATPLADYLIPIFDEWWHESDTSVAVRIFVEILKLLLGSRQHVDALGGDPVNLAVIESDGSIEPLDALRSCRDGLTQMGLNVLRQPIEALHQQTLFQMAMAGQEGLSATCRECDLRTVCGAGYLPNRYSSSNNFDNPSVFCRDYIKLISHIHDAACSAVDWQKLEATRTAARRAPERAVCAA